MSDKRWDLATAVQGQLLYAALVILWQVSGKMLAAMGLPSPGPSPSLVVAGIAFLVAGAMVLAASRMPLVYGFLAMLCAYAAATTIQNAFVADPSLWPSDLARYAGVAINVVGLAAAIYSLTAVVIHFRDRSAHAE